jgi:hypothetical protein
MEGVRARRAAPRQGILRRRGPWSGSFDFARLPNLDTERRLEQLAAWIVDAENRGERYALKPAEAVRWRSIAVREHRHRCLRALALYGLEPVTAMPPAIAR